jgi:uncharacterized protein (TIGR00730 family)
MDFSTSSLSSVCVFCGSSNAANPDFLAAAAQFGAILAEEGLRLVYGGTRKGLMGILADATLAAGGLVSGIITHGLAARGHSHPALTELRSVDTIQERKRAMIEQADGFIALPGGIGTLEEVFEVWTLAQLEPSQQSKPIGLLNVQGFFDPLLGMVDRMIEQGFLPASHRQMLQVSASPEALLQAFANYRPVAEPKWLS